MTFTRQRIFMQNGPDNALCDNSVRGWFNGSLFEKYFLFFLEAVKNTPNIKILQDDNLASNFSERVFNACKENDIKFVNSMLPNATYFL